MSRYRLLRTPAQQAVLRDHCPHARMRENLAVEQHSHWHPSRTGAPGYLEQCRQLTQARAEHPWLAAGSQTVQQQALRDFARAMAAFFDPANPAGRPSCARPGALRDSALWGGAGDTGTCAACPVRSAKSGCPRPGGCGSAGLAPCPEDWAEKTSTDIARRFDLIRVEDLQDSLAFDGHVVCSCCVVRSAGSGHQAQARAVSRQAFCSCPRSPASRDSDIDTSFALLNETRLRT